MCLSLYLVQAAINHLPCVLRKTIGQSYSPIYLIATISKYTQTIQRKHTPLFISSNPEIILMYEEVSMSYYTTLLNFFLMLARRSCMEFVVFCLKIKSRSLKLIDMLIIITLEA